jgi:hypothetical protein
MKTIIAAFAILVASPAWAADTTPTDLELRASYCMKVEKDLVSALDARLAGSDDSAPGYEAVVLLRSQEGARLDRYQAYVMPKLSTRDAGAMSASVRRAEADMANVDNPEAVKRIQGCRDADWLPF